MAALRLVHRRRQIRRDRVFRDRSNPLDAYNDAELFERFRFPRRELLEIFDEFGGEIRALSTRKENLPDYLQILIAIRYFATGSFQLVLADIFGVSKPNVHRCIKRVSDAIARHLRNHVKFESDRETVCTKAAFFGMAGFPNVIGCIDCTHIKIVAPSVNEHEFVNRKGYHSINVQLLCNANLNILNCSVKWPGSVHDARILKESGLFRMFERVPPHRDGFILGDGGYMLKSWLLTPYLHAVNQSEVNYNFAQACTRSTIERCNGVLKRRWHSLHGEVRYSPDRACKIIISCIILHNRATACGLPDPEDICDADCIQNDHDDHQHGCNARLDHAEEEPAFELQNLNGRIVRNRITHEYF